MKMKDNEGIELGVGGGEGVGSCKNEESPHALVLACPVQGHINPMLQFSKRLQSKGTKVTFLIPTSNSKPFQLNSGSVDVVIISDGSDQAKEGEELSMKDQLERFHDGLTRSLGNFLEREGYLGRPAQVLIYDSFIPYVLDVALRHGIHGAPFFTQSCAVCGVYYLVHEGNVRIPSEGRTAEAGKAGRAVVGDIPVLPMLGPDDLPSFVSNMNSYPDLTKLVIGQFSNFRKARWMLFNTFAELEEDVVEWMASEWPLLTIGPTVPSKYLDERLTDDEDYGLSLFEPEVEASTKWLDSKEAGSVAYVSFGSLAALGEDQMEEIANGLKIIKGDFLWVVRESEEKKLPPGLVNEMSASGKGLIVRWCPQLQVLSHKSVGCFVTHCGWNSTLEALSLGIPMAVMPQWTDQPTNAKFIVDVWKVGARIVRNEKGIVTAKEIGKCINEIMLEDQGREIRERSTKWKELAQRALREGGSSDQNIDKFVAELMECTLNQEDHLH